MNKRDEAVLSFFSFSFSYDSLGGGRRRGGDRTEKNEKEDFKKKKYLHKIMNKRAWSRGVD